MVLWGEGIQQRRAIQTRKGGNAWTNHKEEKNEDVRKMK